MRPRLRALGTAAALCLGGCSIFARTTDDVLVTASDPAAALYADGSFIGTGSATATVRSNEDHVFTAILGDRTAKEGTRTHVSTTGMIDAIFGFVLLVPFIGLATPGAHSVDRTSVLLVLPPAGSSPPTQP